MNHLLDDDDDPRGRPNEREITLSTSAVLGIFFGLVLLCALFFGFGYNMGHKSVQPVAALPDASGSPSTTTNFNTFKPAAGSPASASSSPAPATPPVVVTTPASSPAVSEAPPVRPSSPAATSAFNTAQPASHPPLTPVPVTLGHSAPAPVPSITGSFIVQVAAVSHQEDADLLVGALKQRGYSVTAHTAPQDKLLHIQVGPFNNRKDADAMRQRLLADGYNAIVK